MTDHAAQPIGLDAHPLFAGVSEPARVEITASARIERVGRGDLVSRPGMLRHELLLVLDGYLHSYDVTDDGGRVLFEVVGPGGVDAALGALGGIAHFTEAVTNVQLARLPHDALERALRLDPTLSLNLLRILAERVSRREQQVAAAALRDPDRQIAKQLLAISGSIGDDESDSPRMGVRVTHQQIADMLGIRRETVTIHLHQLAKVGAVVLRPSGVAISRSRLQAVVDGRLHVPRVPERATRRGGARGLPA